MSAGQHLVWPDFIRKYTCFEAAAEKNIYRRDQWLNRVGDAQREVESLGPGGVIELAGC